MKKIKVAEENGYSHVINYTKKDFVEEVMKITKNEGVPAVFDGVGKKTFKGSLACLKTRGMMISFGNASGPLEPVNVPKEIQPKGLYLTRPSIGQYFTNRRELQDGADSVFEKVKFGKIKVRIAKKYYETEASGNISLNTVKNVSKTGVDRISVGSITHSAPTLDLKLEI